MKAQDYPEAMRGLIECLGRLPGTGRRSAERLALWFLQHGRAEASDLSHALVQAVEQTTTCPRCGFFSSGGELCTACADPTRDATLLCVVEQPTDVLPIERSGFFHGLYHCLGGKLSPLDGILPEQLRISALVERVREHPGCEVILALGSDVEGDATALYLAELLEALPCSLSRIAQGMPAGAGLSQADSITLMRALQGRVGIHNCPKEIDGKTEH